MMLLEHTQIVSKPLVEKSSDGALRLSGIVMQSEIKNKNGRIYPKQIIEDVVNKFNQAGKLVIGELNHPDNLEINLERAAIVLEKMWMEGNDCYATMRCLDTPCGNIVKSIAESGVEIGISSRAGGEVIREGDADVVKSMEFLTCDIVSNPSAPNAFPKPIRESIEQAEDAFKRSVLKEENQKKLADMIVNTLSEALEESVSLKESKSVFTKKQAEEYVRNKAKHDDAWGDYSITWNGKKHISKTLNGLVDKVLKSDKTIVEESASSEFVAKNIYSEDGKKVDGARSGKFYLGAEDSDGNITNMNWKKWKSLDVSGKPSEYVQKEVIKSLLSQIKNFGTKVDFNSFSRGKGFEEKVDWLLTNGGCKFPKTGLKAV